ncbi:MAG: hypothetical protein NZ888_00465 [Candidatus Nitrosocaldus sp.]|nr:hypothetical protein [Candidatus Nitrosocaldus sp.]MDW7999543.1 hypothetical protein [Candidatus Nitrosocaldus sp.]
MQPHAPDEHPLLTSITITMPTLLTVPLLLPYPLVMMEYPEHDEVHSKAYQCYYEHVTPLYYPRLEEAHVRFVEQYYG